MPNKHGRSHNGRGPTTEFRVSMKERLLIERPYCHWCGRQFKGPLSRYRGQKVLFKPTLEHIVALADGGTNDYSNLALACHPCNTQHHKRQESR